MTITALKSIDDVGISGCVTILQYMLSYAKVHIVINIIKKSPIENFFIFIN